MPANLLLLPLLGGYWFLHTFQYTRFRSQRLDGYRLLMESALAGVIFLLLARPFVVALWSIPFIRSAWLAIAPQDLPYLGTACASVIVGMVLPYALNALLNATGLLPKEVAQLRAIDRHGNHLLRLIHTASASETPISLTLDNRKVYIGLVTGAPNLEPHDAFVSITPFFSGYRDANTLELILTVPYLHVYDDQGLDPAAFRVTIPVAGIRSASLFDHTAYPAFVIEAATSQHPPGSAPA